MNESFPGLTCGTSNCKPALADQSPLCRAVDCSYEFSLRLVGIRSLPSQLLAALAAWSPRHSGLGNRGSLMQWQGLTSGADCHGRPLGPLLPKLVPVFPGEAATRARAFPTPDFWRNYSGGLNSFGSVMGSVLSSLF